MPRTSRFTRRNDIAIPKYRAIEETFTGEVQETVRRFQDGSLGRHAAIRQFSHQLREAQFQTFRAARFIWKKSDAPSISAAEAQMLAGRHRHQMRYFARFLDDVALGRGRMPYMQRAKMYAESLWSIFQRGEAADWDSPNRQKRYFWHLDISGAEHCQDCLDRARVSRRVGGFTWDELVEIGFPGDGTTTCRNHCQCHLSVAKSYTKIDPQRRQELVNEIRGIAPDIPREAAIEVARRVASFGEGLPAAGVAFVRINPARLLDILAANPDIIYQLDTVRRVLESPGRVLSDGGIKRYLGAGLQITLFREDGLWWLLGIVAVAEAERRRREKQA